MNSLASLVTNSGLDREFCVRLTTAFVHFTWEGIILLGVSATIAAGLRRGSARLRYALQLGTLVALVGCLPATYALLEGRHGNSLSPPRIAAEMTPNDALPSDGSELLTVEGIPDSPSLSVASITRPFPREATMPGEPRPLIAGVESGQTFFNDPSADPEPVRLLPRVAPFAVAAYLIGVLAMTLRLLAALCGGHRLRAAAIPASEPQLLELVRREATRLGLKFVPSVAWCWQISTPIVVGVLRPMILLPASVVVGLSPEDLAGVLLHELAHIRRFDLVVNLFQRMIETLLFFHPAAWFVSRQISRERENCCDDCVVNAGWPRKAYAELLVRVAEVCSASMPQIAPATGMGITAEGPSELKRRVLRLLAMEPRTRLCLSRSGVLLLGVILIGGVGGAALLEGREPDSNAGTQSKKEASGKTDSGRDGISFPERPATALQGFALTPDGKPAVGAQVAIANWSVDVQFLNGKLAYAGSAAERKLAIVETDAAGRFRLPKEADPQAIVVAHASGYAEVDDPRRVLREAASHPESGTKPPKADTPAAADAELRINLQRYGRVIGTLQQGENPVAGVQFQIGSMSSRPYRRAPSRISHVLETDRTGRFVIPRVPPGPAFCQRCAVVRGKTMPLGGLLAHFEVAAGQVTNLALSSPGPTVVGKLEAPRGFEGRIVWPNVELQLSLRAAPNEGFGVGLPGGGQRNEAVDPWTAFLQSDEGKAYVRWGIPIADDGSFRIDGMLPADYVATVTIPANALKEQASLRATHFPVRVTPASQTAVRATIDVGTIPLNSERTAGETPGATPASEQPQKSATPDDRAQTIALRAHRAMRAIDTLPRFYLRIAEGNGTVDTQRDAAACTLDGLKQAIDGPVNQHEGYFDSRTTLAWSEKQAFWGSGAANVLSSVPARGQYRFWAPDVAWERHQYEDQPPEFIFVSEGERLAESITYNGIFRMTPHRFWWGLPTTHHAQIEPVPTELAAYRTAGEELFDGELCDVVESVRRAERLWVSRETGLLRGAVQYYRTGVFTEARGQAYKALSEIYQDYDESPDPAAPKEDKQSREQALQSALSVLDDYDGPFEPNELVCFRDIRQIAPDVWFPFREDRAFTHPAASGPDRKKYIRLWWSAEDVRTNVDLTEAIRNLGPKAGDKVSQDQRFGLPLTYEYRPGRTPRELLELIQTEQHTPQMRGFQAQLTLRLREMVGKPAPLLPTAQWIGGDAPQVDGTPHLLHFWADWSKTSPDDFPKLKQLAEEGATILGIHPAGIPDQKIAKAIEKHQLSYPTLLAPANGNEKSNQKIAGYPVWDYPYCVLIDRHGRIAEHGRLTPELLDHFRELRERVKE